MNNRIRLMWIIFIFLIVFCALLLTILWLMQTTFLNDMYEGVRKTEIKKAITLVENNIDSPQLMTILFNLEREQEIIVTPKLDYVPPIKIGGKDPPIGRKAITETRDFTTADGKTASFVFYAIISPVDATISTLKTQLMYVTIIMLILSIVLAIAIAKIVSRPIENLNEKAKILATGEYNVQFSGEGYKEICELSETLNHTASELSKVENHRRELMANISHDLRTPLALIYGYAEMMNDFPKEINQEQTTLIMKETLRLSSLVDDVLDVSRLESGTLELKLTEYNLTESIQKSIQRISSLVSNNGYSINFIYNEEVFVQADELKISQVIYNLLINAIHYSTNDLNIIVRQIIIDNKIRIEIEDHGIGIKKEDIPYIWDRYYKSSDNHKRAITGSGLGLSIVKKIIGLHRGNYGVQSTPGQGSIFWFEINTKYQ